MRLNKGSRRGFTLIEVLVAIVLVGIAVSALSTSLGAMTNAYRRGMERETLQSLAQEKLDELIGTGDWTTLTNGSFDGDRYADFTWTLETQTTTIENLEYLKLTVTRQSFGRTDTALTDGRAYRTNATTTTTPPGGPGQ